MLGTIMNDQMWRHAYQLFSDLFEVNLDRDVTRSRDFAVGMVPAVREFYALLFELEELEVVECRDGIDADECGGEVPALETVLFFATAEMDCFWGYLKKDAHLPDPPVYQFDLNWDELTDDCEVDLEDLVNSGIHSESVCEFLVGYVLSYCGYEREVKVRNDPELLSTERLNAIFGEVQRFGFLEVRSKTDAMFVRANGGLSAFNDPSVLVLTANLIKERASLLSPFLVREPYTGPRYNGDSMPPLG